jgi:hypothetical protein
LKFPTFVGTLSDKLTKTSAKTTGTEELDFYIGLEAFANTPADGGSQ